MNFNKNKNYQDLYNTFNEKSTIELLEYLTLRCKVFDVDYCEDKSTALTELWIRDFILKVIASRNSEEMFIICSREE